MNLRQRGAGQVQVFGCVGDDTFAVAEEHQHTRALGERQGHAGCTVCSQHRRGHARALRLQVGQQRQLKIHIERTARTNGAEPCHVTAAIRGSHRVVVIEVATDQIALLHGQAVVTFYPLRHRRGCGRGVGGKQDRVRRWGWMHAAFCMRAIRRMRTDGGTWRAFEQKARQRLLLVRKRYQNHSTTRHAYQGSGAPL